MWVDRLLMMSTAAGLQVGLHRILRTVQVTGYLNPVVLWLIFGLLYCLVFFGAAEGEVLKRSVCLENIPVP